MVTLIYEPSVFMVCKPQKVNLNEFLAAHNVVNWGANHASDSDAEIVCEAAGRQCYNFGKPRPGGTEAYFKHILEVQHGSVCEHVNWTFAITGVSRSLTHELIRHRHLSFSQLSQRYVDESDVAFVVPKDLQIEVRGAESTMKIHKNTANQLLAAIRNDVRGEWEGLSKYDRVGLSWVAHCEDCLEEYVYQVNYLADKTKDEPDTTLRRKAARQAARSVLPNCAETRIFVTGNCRSWRNVIEQRGSKHAEPEIRHLAYKVWSVLNQEAPALFGDYDWTLNDGETPVDVSTPYRKV
jgi:thymidylate synthase (FAD)